MSTMTLDKRIASGADDVEQRGSKMSLASSDLELVFDASTKQVVGLRFTNLDIPTGAVITNAYIQFQTNEVGSVQTLLQIRGLASDDLAAFTSKNNNLSLRPTTTNSAEWRPAAWTSVNEAGAAQRTPDLAAIVQEIVSRSGWQPGYDLGFSISGSGTRNAFAFEGGAAKAPLLHIEYSLPATNAAPTLDLDGSAAGANYSTLLAKGTFSVPLVDTDVVITDANNSSMQGLTATITNLKPGDTLAVNGTLPTGIVITNSTASSITLNGSASIADYQAVARQLSFNNSSADPDPVARQIQITVSDGQALSNVATTTIAIQNVAPALDLDGSAGGTGYSKVFPRQHQRPRRQRNAAFDGHVDQPQGQ